MSDKQLILSIRNGNVNNEDYNFGIDASNVFLEKKDDGVENYETLQDKIDLLNKSMRLDDRSGSAVGIRSIAYGYSTIASGAESFASGYKTQATGARSFSAGFGTQATGENSFACGESTGASGECSYVEGKNSRAIGDSSHAEGYQTNALGNYSHAEGTYTMAQGGYSHAEGYQTSAQGEGSHAEGFKTLAEGTYSHAEGCQTLARGLMSHAEGYQTNALGSYSHAEGYQTSAQGESSHAEGYLTKALGAGSHAEGYQTTANGDYAHAEGYQSIAQGNYSHAEGSATSHGEYSHAEGFHTEAYGNYSHAEGAYTKAYGNYSHAEGAYTKAYEKYSHVEGLDNEALGEGIHIEGVGNKNITGTEIEGFAYYISEPLSNGVVGELSSMNPLQITSSANKNFDFRVYQYAYSLSNLPESWAHIGIFRGSVQGNRYGDVYNNVVLDRNNRNSGVLYTLEELNLSTLQGAKLYVKEKFDIMQIGNKEYSEWSHVQGKYSVPGDFSHIVGGGLDIDNRKNIHTIDWDGNAMFAGDINFCYTISATEEQNGFSLVTSLSEKIFELEGRLKALENK